MDEDECCCCSKESGDRCFVIFVVLLMAHCILSYWYLLIWGWSLWRTLFGWMNIIFFHSGSYILIYSYYKAITTCPGYVDKSWVPKDATPEELEEAKNLKNIGPNIQSIDDFHKPRYCQYCKAFKPPRSHHCSDCRRCVLKMDHHCPWVNNCVGFKNHKFFILFLFYSSVVLTYFLGSCLIRFIYILKESNGTININPLEGGLLFSHLIFTLPVTLGIQSLFFYQMSILWENCTSVETFINKRYRQIAKSTGIPNWKWFYDYGWKNNYKQILGSTYKEWFFPVYPNNFLEDDGIVWKTHNYARFSVLEGDDSGDISLGMTISKRAKSKAAEYV